MFSLLTDLRYLGCCPRCVADGDVFVFEYSFFKDFHCLRNPPGYSLLLPPPLHTSSPPLALRMEMLNLVEDKNWNTVGNVGNSKWWTSEIHLQLNFAFSVLLFFLFKFSSSIHIIHYELVAIHLILYRKHLLLSILYLIPWTQIIETFCLWTFLENSSIPFSLLLLQFSFFSIVHVHPTKSS